MNTEKEKMIAGDLYLASDPQLLKERRNAKRLLRALNITEYLTTKTSKLILKELIPNAGKNLYIEPPFHCDYGYNIYCGDHVYFNVNCVVLDTMPIKIGSKTISLLSKFVCDKVCLYSILTLALGKILPKASFLPTVIKAA